MAGLDLGGRAVTAWMRVGDESTKERAGIGMNEALSHSGLNENHDVDELAFALFRPSPGSDALQTVGIAQGQFDTQAILGNFRRQKVKATMVRTAIR